MPDPQAVNSMFARIAGRYDLANRLLSGGIDVWWRRKLIQRVASKSPADVLDLATGSGDVAFALARGLPVGTPILGMDFCQPMLDEAEKKKPTMRESARVTFQQGDGLNLPCEDASFDAATISFGLRNMADRHRCLTELHRVLRPGGYLWVLEFSQPKKWMSPFYYFYLKLILPLVAALVTGDKNAYDYLGGSIEAFPDHHGIAEEMTNAGFEIGTIDRMTGGIVALHGGRKS
ncbi:MAG: bifunctional demethylmenaquinone methyltransferase/2-methoxy-6-polyprenyl-1,4-benzoquinol methylase UbiE [Synoicihabitans sp.]